MSNPNPLQSRLALGLKRKSLLARRSMLESRLLHWKALRRGAAALYRDYCHEDAKIADYTKDLSFRAVRMQRAMVSELESINAELEITVRELAVICVGQTWRDDRALQEALDNEIS